MGKRSRIEWHNNSALIWTWGLTLIVSGVGLLLLGVAAVLWVVRTPAEVAGGGGRFMVLAIFGAVALLVAVAGRITSANALRYADSTLPQVPHQLGVAHQVGRQRRSLRRRSGIAYLYMAVTVGGLAGSALATWNDPPRAGSLLLLALAAGGGVGCYLAGPAARFVVTPEYFRIETALRRISVPRHLLGDFSQLGVKIRLDLTNGDHVQFRVDSPLLDGGNSRYRTNGRTQARTVERIVAMLRDVPSAGSVDSQVVRAPRWAMIALAVAAGLVSVAAFIAPVLLPALRP
ncbi:hypothetical protein Q2K19_08835 [Micromonospora soli]|uniref:hypothetical protein n=1 Tax=Micromonospora sp. NBRC 110009 TaxID=3061627 RepID=UPI00267291ED|nr:hypothetical protein [Micromonospora sp. NBRC 110009]WKU00569.1 hypothetical protein Q2K19_08835 [Micromonospora sp. NBRC 110009]